MIDASSRSFSAISLTIGFAFMFFVSFLIFKNTDLVNIITGYNSNQIGFKELFGSIFDVIFNATEIFLKWLILTFLSIGTIFISLHYFEIKTKKALLDSNIENTKQVVTYQYSDFIDSKEYLKIAEFTMDKFYFREITIYNAYRIVLGNYLNAYKAFMDIDSRDFKEKQELDIIKKMIKNMDTINSYLIENKSNLKLLNKIVLLNALYSKDEKYVSNEKVFKLSENGINFKTKFSFDFYDKNLIKLIDEELVLKEELFKETQY